MTLNDEAKYFWDNNTPWDRQYYIKELHLLCYAINYDDLNFDEKQKVRDFMKSTRE